MDYTKIANIDLIKELGIDELPKEKREKVILEIGEVMQQRLLLRIIDEVPEEKRNEFVKQLEENEKDDKRIEEILKENVPNIEEIITEEVGKYKAELLEFMESAVEKDNK